MKKEHLGILEMVLCAALWSIAGIFMKLLPWHSFAIASLRSFFAALTFVVWMAVRRYRFCLTRRTLVSGLLTGCVYVCFAAANKLTTAANAIVLQFTCPIFVVLFSALLFRKRIRKADAAVVLIVLCGIALFFFDQLTPSGLLGNFVAIAAGMFMAGMFITIGSLQGRERFSAILIGQLFAFLIGLPAVILTRPVMTPHTVTYILILGVFQLGISYIFYVQASQNCPPLACSLLSAVEPLLNPVWVMLFDGERPGFFALLGGVIVIVSITVWCIRGQSPEAQTV
ncbi:MAG: DMT family transporter [Oscillospiraceae bacterium]|nr:DMT family transporter [Oscillospiraceae bacterium]